MANTRFYKTIVRFEVLSADGPFKGSLERLAEEVTNGGMSGRFLEPEVSELTREEASAALVVQGSAPDFLDGVLDDDGDEHAHDEAAVG